MTQLSEPGVVKIPSPRDTSCRGGPAGLSGSLQAAIDRHYRWPTAPKRNSVHDYHVGTNSLNTLLSPGAPGLPGWKSRDCSRL